MLNQLFDSHDKELNRKELSFVKLSWILLIVALVLPTLLRLFAFGQFWTPDFTVFFRVIGMDPMNSSGFASIFVLYLMARPSKKQFYAILAVAVAVELYYLIAFLPNTMTWVQKFISSGGGFAVAGLLGLLLQSAVGPSAQGKTRARTMLRLSLALALYPFTSATTLGYLSKVTPLVYDSHAYLLDGTFGFQPSAKVAQFLSGDFIGPLFDVVYTRLPIWVAGGIFLSILYEDRVYFDLLLAYMISGVIVMGYYYILPMIGIDDFLSPKYWPWNPPAEIPPAIIPAPPDLPRSCLPSMHCTWILLTFYTICRISRGWAVLGGLFTAMTIGAAMSTAVGHYLVDFFPSFPFTLGCIALITSPTDRNQNWKLISLLYGFGSTAFVAAAIRGYGPDLTHYPVMFWGSMTAMVVVACWLETKLAATSLATDQAPS